MIPEKPNENQMRRLLAFLEPTPSCLGKTVKTGRPCKRKVVEGEKYCSFHLPITPSTDALWAREYSRERRFAIADLVYGQAAQIVSRVPEMYSSPSEYLKAMIEANCTVEDAKLAISILDRKLAEVDERIKEARARTCGGWQ